MEKNIIICCESENTNDDIPELNLELEVDKYRFIFWK